MLINTIVLIYKQVFLKIAMESQQETSVSIDEIGLFSSELEKMVQYTNASKSDSTPFRRQTKALLRKHAAFYKHSYSSIIVQLIIPLVFIVGKPSPIFYPSHRY